jgi:hypothetical protein
MSENFSAETEEAQNGDQEGLEEESDGERVAVSDHAAGNSGRKRKLLEERFRGSLDGLARPRFSSEKVASFWRHFCRGRHPAERGSRVFNHFVGWKIESYFLKQM